MKIVCAALSVLVVASPASALSRFNPMDRSCAAVQQSIASERVVLLRYPSRDGHVMLYDRYVADSNQCSEGYYAGYASVPTHDNPHCPVLNCHSASNLQPR
jgi:hypothetical protein